MHQLLGLLQLALSTAPQEGGYSIRQDNLPGKKGAQAGHRRGGTDRAQLRQMGGIKQ